MIEERIIEVVKYSGLTIIDFAKECGVSYDMIYSYSVGRRACGVVILQKIAEKFPEINLRWLLTGQGEMLSAEVKAVLKRVR